MNHLIMVIFYVNRDSLITVESQHEFSFRSLHVHQNCFCVKVIQAYYIRRLSFSRDSEGVS